MAEKTILSVDLYDNILTTDPSDYTGKVKITGTLRNADIAARIVAERTEYRKETIENILNLADQKKIEAIAEGKSLVDGVGQYLLNSRTIYTERDYLGWCQLSDVESTPDTSPELLWVGFRTVCEVGRKSGACGGAG